MIVIRFLLPTMNICRTQLTKLRELLNLCFNKSCSIVQFFRRRCVYFNNNFYSQQYVLTALCRKNSGSSEVFKKWKNWFSFEGNKFLRNIFCSKYFLREFTFAVWPNKTANFLARYIRKNSKLVYLLQFFPRLLKSLNVFYLLNGILENPLTSLLLCSS